MLDFDLYTTLVVSSLVCGLLLLGGLLIGPTLGGRLPALNRLNTTNGLLLAMLVLRVAMGRHHWLPGALLFWSLWIAANSTIYSALRHANGLPVIDRKITMVTIAALLVLLLVAAVTGNMIWTGMLANLMLMSGFGATLHASMSPVPPYLRRAKACLAAPFALGALVSALYLLRFFNAARQGVDWLDTTPLIYIALLGGTLTVNVGLTMLFYIRLVERNGELAHHDELTGLLNRRGLGIRLAARKGSADHLDSARGAIIAIDIDHFKQINDQHGHAVGDQVLRWFAETIRRMTRHDDLLVRLGGEEFGVVMLGCSIDQAWINAERIREEFERHTVFNGAGGLSLRVTASFGIAPLRTDCALIDADLARADAALYEAKRAGRDRVHRWADSISSINGDAEAFALAHSADQDH